MKEIVRCFGTGNKLYEEYHDFEWGVPIHDDRMLFELLILEGAQAGLSWITILKRRETYKKAFDNFDVQIISQYDSEKVKLLMGDPGIIRNKLKIEATILNARGFIQIQKEYGSFNKFIWNYVNNTPIVGQWENLHDIPASTPLSDRISNDLKKYGFKFVGTTIIYAYLQAIGIVNDHCKKCLVWD